MTRPESTPKNHYSYAVYADPDTARTFDDRRFGGPIGGLVAQDQANVLLEFVGEPAGRSILDVGTGTGRAALLLARAGADVTGVDASSEMLAVAGRRAAADGTHARFLLGDAHQLEFPDRSFDTAVSLRVLMHTPGWRQCIAELCRVADRLIVLDFPSAHGLAALESAARRVGHALGRSTEPYRVFRDGSIARAFESNGFRIRSVHRHFVLPIAFHKAIGSRRFTEVAEQALSRIGLVHVIGSPVTIAAERCASS